MSKNKKERNNMSLTHDYSSTLRKEEVLVVLLDKSHFYQTLKEDMTLFSEKYRFTLHTLCSEDDHIEGKKSDFKIKHLIYISDKMDDYHLEEKFSKFCSHFNSMTICFSYSSFLSFEKSRDKIEEYKVKYGNTVNFLRPDDTSEPIKPNHVKILDNSVCDTVRIKYIAKNISKNLNIPDGIIDFFKKCSLLYEEENLFHRASSDGFFAFKFNSDIYITSTKTNKINLNLDRISAIHSYDPKLNIIEYSGLYIPSSDSVEACTIFEKLPELTTIIHTHASEKITRNNSLKKYIIAPPLPYGERKLGLIISENLRNMTDHKWGILEDHGEIFTSNLKSTTEAFDEVKQNIINILSESAKNELDRIFNLDSKENIKKLINKSGLECSKHKRDLELHVNSPL